ncbi:helix-turn-helix domain-containing protein, partial [Amycolatopsis endophytica]
IKLDDLDVICAVLGCEVGELLLPEPDKVAAPGEAESAPAAAVPGAARVVPRRRDGRSLPPA